MISIIIMFVGLWEIIAGGDNDREELRQDQIRIEMEVKRDKIREEINKQYE